MFELRFMCFDYSFKELTWGFSSRPLDRLKEFHEIRPRNRRRQTAFVLNGGRIQPISSHQLPLRTISIYVGRAMTMEIQLINILRHNL
jgi:hypothetical protein